MEERIYNSELKLEYLSSLKLDKSTKDTVLYEFSNTAKTEGEYSKDIYAFNDLEISELLKTLRRSSVISIRRTLSILNRYVKWCIINGKRGKYENNINYVNVFVKTETDLKKYVSNKQLSSKILTKEELNNLIQKLFNPVDQAIIQCMYEFISGEKLHELRNLENKDLNFENNEVTLTDLNGKIRKQKISDKLIRILKDVQDADIYIYNNGIEDSRGNLGERLFAESDYVIKPTKWCNNDYEMMNYHSLLGRIDKIRRFTEYYHITANSLKETRIIHEIIDITKERELYQPNDNVYDEVLSRIYVQYNVEISHMQLYSIKQKFNQLVSIKNF